MSATGHPLIDNAPHDWRVSTVDEVKSSERHACVAGPFGSSISSKFFTDVGVPVIRGSNLAIGLERFIARDFVFVSAETAGKFSAQTVCAGDLVFTCWGTIGQVGLIPNDGPFDRYIISNKQLKLRVDREVLDPLFAFYFFAAPDSVRYIQDRAIGSAVPGINLGILKSLPVLIPPLFIQKRIASIISAYDDLIEVNKRRIAVLEEMARGLFEEWFVRFRFPDHNDVAILDVHESTLPEGWSRCQFGELLEHTVGGLWGEAAPSPKTDQQTLVIRGTDFPKLASGQYETIPTRYVSLKEIQSRSLRPADIILEASGGSKDQPVGRAFYVTSSFASKLGEPMAPASFCRLLRPEGAEGVSEYVFGLLQAMYADRRIEKFQKQSTGLRNLSMRQLASETIIRPAAATLRNYSLFCRPLIEAVSMHRHEIAALRSSRDLLLPRLISGQLSVRQAERELEKAA